MPPREDELKIAGLAAVRAALACRPGDVRRFFLVESRVAEFRDVLAGFAEARLVYRIVPREELDRIAGGPHHEGVCLVTAPLPAVSLDELLGRRGPSLVVAAPGIENPHNVGAILRVAAHFGAAALVLEDADPRLSPAACRTAEGGAEHVAVVRVARVLDALARFRKAGYRIVGSSSHETSTRLGDAALGPRTLLLVGNEAHGLPDAVLRACDQVVAIPGTGWVESLNVATATAILLAEVRRRATA